MKICVAGLGIIGGSICMALKRAGYEVAGYNRSEGPLNYALKNDIIDGVAEDFSVYDTVFVALPPKATVQFINETKFKDGAIVADICGVKQYIEKAVYSKPRNFKYVGTHPMAGKEVSGIKNACADLFDNASMILTRSERTDADALNSMRALVKEMGFAKLLECSSEVHDKKIAYTSQLAHIVSNAYVRDEEIEGCIGFTGGSFQDMTRIAGVDEVVWASLYLENAKNISQKIGGLIDSLQAIKLAIEEGNEAKLQDILRDGRLQFDSNKKFCTKYDIFVQNLK